MTAGTLVVFHAHPDDECMSTGGTIARAAHAGHRVVLVVATNGEHGEVPEDLSPGETLVDRRRRETEASAAILGIDRIVWLGYADSGMTGWPQNDASESFFRADVDEAAGRLAEILREERAAVLTTYDWHGVYGHPDHITVYTVGRRAAELVPGVRHLEVTMNRTAMVEMMKAAPPGTIADNGVDIDPEGPMDDGNPFGEPAEVITHAVDVSRFLAEKRESIRCHASQSTDTSMFLAMPEEIFALAFRTEWFIDRSLPVPDGGQREYLPWIFE
jgi:LmbE family N-acetylglucosaminyl deacetylase